jgi:hypothetical protein
MVYLQQRAQCGEWPNYWSRTGEPFYDLSFELGTALVFRLKMFLLSWAGMRGPSIEIAARTAGTSIDKED